VLYLKYASTLKWLFNELTEPHNVHVRCPSELHFPPTSEPIFRETNSNTKSPPTVYTHKSRRTYNQCVSFEANWFVSVNTVCRMGCTTTISLQTVLWHKCVLTYLLHGAESFLRS
jgi:hypothetical protein